MALTGDALIADALMRHLSTLTTDPVTTIAWHGIPHPGTTPRIEAEFVPNTKTAPTVDGGPDSPGFLVATVVIAEGQGVIVGTNIAAQIAGHFGASLHTTEHRIRFVNPASVSQPFVDGAEVRIPVSIPYLASA